MTFRGQFFFCILGQIKGNRLLVIYGQFPAVISNTDIFAMIVASVFLRTHVIFMQITDTGSKFAKIACPAFINIALMRSVSKVFCLIHTFWQEQADTKSREKCLIWLEWIVIFCHIFEVFAVHATHDRIPLNLHAGSDDSIRCDDPFCINLQETLPEDGGHGRCCVQFQGTIFLCFYSCIISSLCHFIITCFIPQSLDHAIIICRCTPDIHFHRTF